MTDDDAWRECSYCGGSGRVSAAKCKATVQGRRCLMKSRRSVDPEFFAEPFLDPSEYPPDFMDYCGLHGNALARNWKRYQTR